MSSNDRRVLTLERLSVASTDSTIPILNDVNVRIDKGEVVGLVGESGSGKSMTGYTITGLQPANCVITGGSVRFQGLELAGQSEEQLRTIRGRRIAYIFQEPMAALNPGFRIGSQIMDIIQLNAQCDSDQARLRLRQLLEEVQIRDPDRVLNSWPHELSGGMLQRVLIACAFACSPELIIADEPTTALDVSVQNQVLSILRNLTEEHGTAVLFISHDLMLIQRLCSRVYVMLNGQVVESGAVAEVMQHPQHPYSRALINCLPESGQPLRPLPTVTEADRAAPPVH